MNFITKRWAHLMAPNRTITRLLVHMGHVATGFLVSALVWKWFGLPQLLAAGIGGLGWVLFAEGIWDGAIRKLQGKLPVKAFQDHIYDASQILAGAAVFGLPHPQDVQVLVCFLVVYFLWCPWIE